MKVSNPRSDLEERTFRFAQCVRAFVRKLPRGIIHTQDGVQLIRSSGSIGANYIEAQEAMSKKDFGMRVKICRKEAKESRYWLNLLADLPDTLRDEHSKLLREALELTKIFSSIVEKVRT
jgi:four helix bundle protein